MGLSFHDWLDEQFWWWPIHARMEGLRHLLQGHQVAWRCHVDLWVGCTGNISCHTCDLSIWCRSSTLLLKLSQWVCNKLGHQELKNPGKYIGWDDTTDKPMFEPILDKWYCSRCIADVRS